jgi:hypothetical protein
MPNQVTFEQASDLANLMSNSPLNHNLTILCESVGLLENIDNLREEEVTGPIYMAQFTSTLFDIANVATVELTPVLLAMFENLFKAELN